MNLAVDGVRAGDPEGASNLLAILEDGTRTRDWFRWMNELRREAVATEHYAARGAFERDARAGANARGDRRHASARATTCARPRATGPRSTLAGGGDLREAAAKLGARARRAARLPGSARDAGNRGACWGCCGCGWDEAAARATLSWPPPPTSTRSSRGTDEPALRASFLGSPAVREVLAQAGRA